MMKRPMKFVSLLTAAALAFSAFIVAETPMIAKADEVTYKLALAPESYEFDNAKNKSREYTASIKNGSGEKVETSASWWTVSLVGENYEAFTFSNGTRDGGELTGEFGPGVYAECDTGKFTVAVTDKASTLLANAKAKDSKATSISVKLYAANAVGSGEDTQYIEDQYVTITYTETSAPAVGDEVKAKDATYKVTAEGAVEYEAPADEKATTVTIPDEIKDENGNVFKVTGIAPKALKGKKIKKLKVGKNVTRIGASACDGCSKLGNVELEGDTVKTIEKNAFRKIKKGAKFKIRAKKLKTAEKLIKKINKKGGAKTAVLKYKKAKSSKKSKK